MENEINAIDLVYYWVDGNDPVWQAKRNAFIGKESPNDERNCKGRYANNDELKYSLRSVEMYAPWIRKIFIVTDNQVPEWLDTSNPKVQIIDHTEILPAESLPCFNSCLIGHYVYRIPGLSEHFLIANDDTFINQEVKPEDFFTPSGFPIIWLRRKPFRRLRWYWREKVRQKPLSYYRKTIDRASRLVHAKYGIYYTGMPHHNIIACSKSNCQHVAEEVMRNEFQANHKNHMRSDNDVQNIVFSYVALAEGHGEMRYVTSKESMLVYIYKKKDYEALEKYHPVLFCMNDSERATDSDRVKEKAYLEKLFPNKSRFEKQITNR